MSLSTEACAAISEACAATTNMLRRFFRVRDGRNQIDDPMLDVQREDALNTVAVVVCRLGRYLRVVRTQAADLGPWRKELLDVLSSFDMILHAYSWRDDPGGPSSMNDPDAWRASWPVKWPFLPYLRPGLLDALERAGRQLHEALQRPAPPARSESPPAPESLRPRWDRDRGKKLWFGDTLCREFAREAPDQFLILDEFERRHWPRQIRLPQLKERLKTTLGNLNKGLADAPIEFAADGSGRGGIVWREKPLP